MRCSAQGVGGCPCDGTYAVGGLPAERYRVCGPNRVCLPELVTVTSGVVTSSIDITVP